jgi:hypothetical protein
VIAGFLAGSAVKKNGALNAGLRMFLIFLPQFPIADYDWYPS